MKALYYIKTTFKGMVSNCFSTLAMYILLPVIFACFMAGINNVFSNDNLKLNVLKVQIVDEDNSEMSKHLIETLKSDEMKEIVKIVDKKPEVELLIKKGYGEKVLALNKGEIFINKKVGGREFTVDTFRLMLDKYHQGLYVSFSGGNLETLSKIDTSKLIENEVIDTIKSNNQYETISASMVGFVVMNLIFALIKTGYSEVSMNLNNRICSTPINKLQFLFYDTISALIYSFIIILGYVMFFRLTNLSFKGSILDLMILVFTSVVLVVSIAKTVSTFFGSKYGNSIANLLFMLTFVGGEMFTGRGNKLSLLTPTHYLSNAFSMYNSSGNLEGCGNIIFIILGISVGIYLLAIIKQGINWRKKICA